eukprot:TRINITY_DN6816_c1_g1_i4.p1 TRINITY_DN6816_c1_g1~~TRINITY_DN6816_c1_g1_i4.p1  ORF type:complete len:253 (+),score=45.35 TRINITY_DN6816_c1_g1_i4:146-904(+)
MQAALGVEHFVLYDAGGVDKAMMAVLAPFVKARIVEVVDMRGGHKFKSWLSVWAANDCAYRSHYTSEWVLATSLDEYLVMVDPSTNEPSPSAFSELLEQSREKPWISFGTMEWTVELCRGMPEDFHHWPIERMHFHQPQVHCTEEEGEPRPATCPGIKGWRKYVYNPRKVFATRTHEVVGPDGHGEVVSTDVARINKFQGLDRVSQLLCNEQFREGRDPEWWVGETKFADYVAREVRPKSLIAAQRQDAVSA